MVDKLIIGKVPVVKLNLEVKLFMRKQKEEF